MVRVQIFGFWFIAFSGNPTHLMFTFMDGRFLGNSWASGIALFGSRPYLNGRNQESSSEAIAAYEGVAMFGSVMMKAFGNGVSTNQSYNENAQVACQIFNVGRFLATTEIRSADRYW